MELRGKQKSYLKSRAHHLTPIYQIGKGGLNDEIKSGIRAALDRRELIKVSLLQNTDEEAKDVARILEEQIGVEFVQIIGRTLVLFKTSTKEKYRVLSKEVKGI
ncbi:MAG: ribosome assembly RNA-binding protein YhbY [Streptococcaceae bacterium]|jgi:RNA-binding protein|nr:ribosome assembly RNA-binding protein YhbY [Streptococcaceae bacterium]